MKVGSLDCASSVNNPDNKNNRSLSFFVYDEIKVFKKGGWIERHNKFYSVANPQLTIIPKAAKKGRNMLRK